MKRLQLKSMGALGKAILGSLKQIPKRITVGYIIAAVSVLILTTIANEFFSSLVKKHFFWAKIILLAVWAVATVALINLVVLIIKNIRGLDRLNGRRQELDERERTIYEKMQERIRSSETGNGGFSQYLLSKIETAISRSNNGGSKDILIVGPFDTETQDAFRRLMECKDHVRKLEWYITEATAAKREDLVSDVKVTLKEIKDHALLDRCKLYLTGELPIFSRIIFIPGKAIIGFFGDTWVMWNLENISADYKVVIKEKVFLTPFSEKIKQFFNMRHVHEAISCYLSTAIHRQGFVIGATHPYPLLFTPYKEMFANFTRHQGMLIKSFEDASAKLRSEASLVVANLPLTGNYRAIIDNKYTIQWLIDLKEGANSMKDLQVQRFIYIEGVYTPGEWEIDKGYLAEITPFLKEDFFAGFKHDNYTITCVLTDHSQLVKEYRQYASETGLSLDHQLSPSDLISNWIWFQCKDGYHVLQYEQMLPIDKTVAEAVASKLGEPPDKWRYLSLFMFCDAYPPYDSELMKKYGYLKAFLSEKLPANLSMSLAEFLSKYCITDKK